MKYFAYGSNLSSEELRGWCPHAAFTSIARLDGYRLDFTLYSQRREGGVADIVADANDHVWGVLYDLPEEDLPALDKKEGVARGAYRREDVDLELPAGGAVRAMTYMVVNKGPSETPGQYYLGLILTGAREHALPPEYVERLERFRG